MAGIVGGDMGNDGDGRGENDLPMRRKLPGDERGVRNDWRRRVSDKPALSGNKRGWL